MPMYAHGCLHVCSLLSCTPCARSGHVHYVLLWVCSHHARMWCNPFASYRWKPPHVRPFASQEGGALQDGARSVQCTCCHFAACVGAAAGSQPAATLLCHVCCVAHAHVSHSQPPQPTRHAVVCGPYIVSMASRAELCIKRHSTKKNEKKCAHARRAARKCRQMWIQL